MSKNGANKSRARLACLLALLIAAAPCYADSYIARAGNGDYVKLTDKPCPVPTGYTKMYEAEFKYQGKVYKACWFSMGAVVMVMDETGEATPVPVARFTKEPEA